MHVGWLNTLLPNPNRVVVTYSMCEGITGSGGVLIPSTVPCIMCAFLLKGVNQFKEVATAVEVRCSQTKKEV